MRITRSIGVALLAVGALATSACSSTSAAAPGAGSGEQGSPSSVTIGYFPNLTHAPAIVGLADGHFQQALGDGIEIKTATFNSGTEEIEALFAGGIDIGFIGPSPTVSGWQKSGGQALHVIAGSAANGAALVVRQGIDSPEDLRGTTIATPSLGNTQDIALRHWLQQLGFATDTQGGGDVHIQPQDNATALTALQTGSIDGAWVPEPWATRMILEAGAHVLVDEPELWPGGRFVTTNVIVHADFLANHPETVRAFLEGLLATIDSMAADPTAAQTTVAAEIGRISGSTPDVDQLAAAWQNVQFIADPLASSLIEQANHATEVGLLEAVDLTELYRLDLLNELLRARGEQEVPSS